MKGRKTIFHFMYILDEPGGVELLTLRLIPMLEKTHNNYVVVLREPGAIAEDYRKAGIKIFFLNYRTIWDLAKVFLEFRHLVKQYKPDVLSTYLPIADIYGRIFGRLLRIPKIICNLRSTNKPFKYQIAILADFMTSFAVHEYTVNSPSIHDYYRSCYPYSRKKKFHYIPNIIDIEKWTKSISRDEKKKSLHLDEKNCVVTYVSNLHLSKGHKYLLEAFEYVYTSRLNTELLSYLAKEKQYLLDAFEIIGSAHPESELCIVGEGAERNNLIRQAESYGSEPYIHFLGRRDDVSEILKITDIFVMPTFFEGQSNALLEAMASGCAIITTNIPENRALIKDGESGILVELRDGWAIAKALNWLLENPKERERLGKKAREKILNEFNPEKIIASYQKLYE